MTVPDCGPTGPEVLIGFLVVMLALGSTLYGAAKSWTARTLLYLPCTVGAFMILVGLVGEGSYNLTRAFQGCTNCAPAESSLWAPVYRLLLVNLNLDVPAVIGTLVLAV